MNKPATAVEFPFAGLALVEYRNAAKSLIGCIQNAVQIVDALDPARAALLDQFRTLVLKDLAIVDALISEPVHSESVKES